MCCTSCGKKTEYLYHGLKAKAVCWECLMRLVNQYWNELYAEKK
jgi:hypothetical protein